LKPQNKADISDGRLKTEEENETKEGRKPITGTPSKPIFLPFAYDSESDTCMCTGTCSDCISPKRVAEQILERDELRRKKNEAKLLAIKEKEA